MKIGIVTMFHGNNNWGGVLQGYALKTVLQDKYPDAEIDILKYQSGRNIVYQSNIKQALQYSPIEVLKRVKKKLNKKQNVKTVRLLRERKARFAAFTSLYGGNSKRYNDGNLANAAKVYDCLICGSDQIWNPNVARAAYFLKGVGNECTKISYAASIARNSLSEHEKSVMLPLIKDFDFVSVREKTAKDFLTEYTNGSVKVEEVLDPTLLLSKEKWAALTEEIECSKEKYVFAFFFSESIEYRKRIEKYCSERGLKMKFIAHARNRYIKSDETGECDRLYDVGPKEFLALIRDAEYVFTDSFHGSVFSMIYGKEFCVFERDKNNKISKNSRLYDLLDKFDLSGRLVRSAEDFKAVINERLDYDAINDKLGNYQKQSLEYLTGAISSAKIKQPVKHVTVAELEKDKCCGCGLCANVCPKNCITMKRDTEGFLFPEIGDICVKCGKCVKLCPSLNNNYKSTKFECYVGNNLNEEIRKTSSSGGLFYELAKSIIVENGVVYGAAFDDKFNVKHIRTDSLEQIEKLKTSKYVQSETTDIYPTLLEDLTRGKKVLFSGTPCQIGAIRNFVEDKNLSANLYLVDFICHGVPSPDVWQSYLTYKGGADNLLYVNFRDKRLGWHDFSMLMKYKDSKKYSKSHELDIYMDSFLSNQCIRLSCYDCEYKENNYVSDITMGDAWKIERTAPKLADDKGTSLIVVRSGKGKELIGKISSEFPFIDNPYNSWCLYNPSLLYSTNKPKHRDDFFNLFSSRIDDNEFWESRKKRIRKKKKRYFLKKVVKGMGLEKMARKFL